MLLISRWTYAGNSGIGLACASPTFDRFSQYWCPTHCHGTGYQYHRSKEQSGEGRIPHRVFLRLLHEAYWERGKEKSVFAKWRNWATSGTWDLRVKKFFSSSIYGKFCTIFLQRSRACLRPRTCMHSSAKWLIQADLHFIFLSVLVYFSRTCIPFCRGQISIDTHMQRNPFLAVS